MKEEEDGETMNNRPWQLERPSSSLLTTTSSTTTTDTTTTTDKVVEAWTRDYEAEGLFDYRRYSNLVVRENGKLKMVEEVEDEAWKKVGVEGENKKEEEKKKKK